MKKEENDWIDGGWLTCTVHILQHKIQFAISNWNLDQRSPLTVCLFYEYLTMAQWPLPHVSRMSRLNFES